MRRPRVLAVAPAFNRAAVTEAGVRSLAGVRGLGGVIIVDHGCTDGTAARAEGAWDCCEVVAASSRLWWTGAVNVGVAHAFANGATHVVIVNDDQEFDPGFLEPLLDEQARAPDAIVGAKILDATDRRTIVSYGADVDFARGWVAHRGAGAPDDGRFEATLEAGWLNTQGVLVPHAVWRRIGRLDERLFPHYFGDVHLSFRAREVGAKVLVCGRSRTYVTPATTGILRPDLPLDLARGLRSLYSRRSWANLRDQAVFALRHGPRGQRLQYFAQHVLRHARRIVRQALLRRRAYDRAERLLEHAARPRALYFAGWDTRWLFDERPELRGLVDFLVDDHRAGDEHAGLAVVTTEEALARGVATIVVNCAAHEDPIAARLAPLRDKGVAVHRLYGLRG
jgi:hypothetical protein